MSPEVFILGSLAVTAVAGAADIGYRVGKQLVRDSRERRALVSAEANRVANNRAQNWGDKLREWQRGRAIDVN